jgi:hypothetical protein
VHICWRTSRRTHPRRRTDVSSADVVGGFPCQGFQQPVTSRSRTARQPSVHEVLRVVDASGADVHGERARRAQGTAHHHRSRQAWLELRWEVVMAPKWEPRTCAVAGSAWALSPELLTRGCTACTPAATCPAGYWHPPPRTVPRDSLAPGDQKFFDQRCACGQPVVPDAARLRSVVSSLAVLSPAWTRTSQ